MCVGRLGDPSDDPLPARFRLSGSRGGKGGITKPPGVEGRSSTPVAVELAKAVRLDVNVGASGPMSGEDEDDEPSVVVDEGTGSSAWTWVVVIVGDVGVSGSASAAAAALTVADVDRSVLVLGVSEGEGADCRARGGPRF